MVSGGHTGSPGTTQDRKDCTSNYQKYLCGRLYKTRTNGHCPALSETLGFQYRTHCRHHKNDNESREPVEASSTNIIALDSVDLFRIDTFFPS